MSATGKIDPRNPPDWIKAIIENEAGADGLHLRAEVRKTGGAGGARLLALGAGTFAAPLPEGWSFHRGRSYEGRIQPKEEPSSVSENGPKGLNFSPFNPPIRRESSLRPLRR